MQDLRRREWPAVEQRAALHGSAAILRGLRLVVVTGIPATAQSTGNLHKAVSCSRAMHGCSGDCLTASIGSAIGVDLLRRPRRSLISKFCGA